MHIGKQIRHGYIPFPVQTINQITTETFFQLILKELINSGKMEFAVQLLKKVEQRSASKIIAGLDDPALIAEIATRYPANLLSRRLERIFMDGRVDGRERTRLACSEWGSRPSEGSAAQWAPRPTPTVLAPGEIIVNLYPTKTVVEENFKKKVWA